MGLTLREIKWLVQGHADVSKPWHSHVSLQPCLFPWGYIPISIPNVSAPPCILFTCASISLPLLHQSSKMYAWLPCLKALALFPCDIAKVI